MDLLAPKVLLYALIACVILGAAVAAGLYAAGYENGSQKVRLEWAADRVKAQAEADSLALEAARQLALRDEVHRAEEDQISGELVRARSASDLALASVRDAYERRLLQSDRRAALYLHQAEAGSAAQRSLAEHAAELDRALEEGVELVGELQETLGLRERQLTLLGRQIDADRRAIEGQNP